MSFPRAKIHRFNEARGSTPAPGSYNPKFDHKIIGIGAVMEKSERFTEPKSNGGGGLNDVLNLSFTSGGQKSSSLTNLPVFRTPKVPLKKLASYTKSNTDLSAARSISSGSLELLKVAQKSKEEMINELEYLLNLKIEEVNRLGIEFDLMVKNKAASDHEVNELMKQIAKLESATMCVDESVELAELRALLSDKESIIAKMTDDMQEKQDIMESTVAKFQQDVVTVEKLLSDSKKEQILYEEKMTDLLQVIEEKNRLIITMQGIQDNTNGANETVLTDLLNLRHENAKLEESVSTLHTNYLRSVGTNNLLSDQIKELEKEVFHLYSANDELEADITIWVEENLNICQINFQLDDRATFLENELIRHQTREVELENMIKAKNVSISDLEQMIEHARLEKISDKNILEDKISEIEYEVYILIDGKRKHEEELQIKEQSIYRREKDLKALHTEISELKLENLTVQHDYDRKVADLQQELSSMIQSKTELENKLTKKQSMILLLQGELSEKEVQLVENSTDYIKLAEQLENEKVRLHAETKAEVSKLSNIIDVLKNNYVKQLSEYEGNTKVMQDNILNGSLLRENLETTLSCKYSEFIELEQKFNDVKADYEFKIAAQSKDAETKHNEVIFELLETHAKLQLTEGHLEEVKSRSKKSKEELEENLVMLLAEKEANALTRDELRVSNLEYQLTVVELEEKVEELTLEIKTNIKVYEIKLGDYRTQLELSQLRCKKLQICNDNLQESLVAIRDRLMESSTHTEIQNKLIVNLETSNLVLEKKLDIQSQSLESQKKSMDDMEAKNIDEINKMRADLLGKLTELRENAREEKEALAISKMNYEQGVQSQLTVLCKEIEAYAVEKSQMIESHSTLQRSFKGQGMELEETKFDLLQTKDRLKIEEQKAMKYSKELKELLSNYKIEIAKYTKDLQGALTLIESSNLAHDHEIKDLSNALEDARAEVNEGILAEQENEREIDELGEKLDHQNECAKLANQKIAALETQTSAQCIEIESLSFKLQSQLADNMNATVLNHNLALEKQDLSAKVKCLCESLNVQNKNCMDLINENHCLTSAMTALEEDTDILKLHLTEEFQVNISALQADNLALHSEILTLTTQLESYEECSSIAAKKEEEIKHLIIERDLEVDKYVELKEHIGHLKLQTTNQLEEKDALFIKMEAEYQGKIDLLQAENSAKLTKLRTALVSANESDVEIQRLKSNDWERRYHEMESLIGPFRQQLEEYEAERGSLESRKEAADHEVKDLSLKYAAILGHQNHKQKIRHVVNLKEHNLELKQELEKAEVEIRHKDKTIKTLKSQVATLTRKNPTSEKSRLLLTPLASKMKENSPARQQSPGSAHPLRELANC